MPWRGVVDARNLDDAADLRGRQVRRRIADVRETAQHREPSWMASGPPPRGRRPSTRARMYRRAAYGLVRPFNAPRGARRRASVAGHRRRRGCGRSSGRRRSGERQRVEAGGEERDQPVDVVLAQARPAACAAPARLVAAAQQHGVEQLARIAEPAARSTSGATPGSARPSASRNARSMRAELLRSTTARPPAPATATRRCTGNCATRRPRARSASRTAPSTRTARLPTVGLRRRRSPRRARVSTRRSAGRRGARRPLRAASPCCRSDS